MSGMKPSHFQTPRTLQDCHFTPGYKGGIYSDQESWEQGKSWALILGIFLALCTLLSLIFGS